MLYICIRNREIKISNKGKNDKGCRSFDAKVAQLVEHDLAKVGVAGSSPVFRSKDARVVELVDTQDLKSCVH